MNLDELHDILYEMLCAIDDACKKENVPYSLGGGTLLGAVRHHDFIPWDDDADLCLWEKDYPAFKSAMQRHLPDYYRLIEPQDLSPNFFDFVCRVQDTRYFWHDETDEDRAYGNKQNHVCVDLFFVNNSANTPAGVKWHTFWQKVIYGLAMGHRVADKSEKYSKIQKLQAAVLGTVGRRIRMERIMQWKNALNRSYAQKPGKYCEISNDIPSYFGLLYERDWFVGTVDVPFRDRMFPIQKGYHEKLTLQYGDYMKPPKDRSIYVTHLEQESSGE